MIKNVAITGSSGFIGTSFIRYNNEFSIREVDLLTQNVENLDLIGIDSVLHLAAMVHQMKEIPAEIYYEVNCILAYNVAKRAKEQGVKQFVLMSTAKVYGELNTLYNCWNEDSECNPVDRYGKSKLQAEKLIRGLEDDTFRVAIVRSPLVYGAGVKVNMLNLIKLVDNIPILPFGGVGNKRSIVYIGNLVALLNVIINKNSSGVFIAGDRNPVSTTLLVKCISQSLGKTRILFRLPNFFIWVIRLIKPAFIDRLFGTLILDNSSTNYSLDFFPPYVCEEGVDEMVKWYKLVKDNKNERND